MKVLFFRVQKLFRTVLKIIVYYYTSQLVYMYAIKLAVFDCTANWSQKFVNGNLFPLFEPKDIMNILLTSYSLFVL